MVSILEGDLGHSRTLRLAVSQRLRYIRELGDGRPPTLPLPLVIVSMTEWLYGSQGERTSG